MPRFSAVALLASVLVVPRAARAEDLTLNEVVRLALAQNERAQIAALEVTTADAAVARARAAFLPSITANGSETLRPYTVEQAGRTTLRNNAASGALTVNQPLFSITAFPLYTGAKHNADAARFDALNQRRQLCFDAAKAFFGVIAQQRILTAARRRLERADASLSDTHARVEAQLVSTNDETRARIERASAVQSVAAAESSVEQARVALGYVLNVAIETDVQTPEESLAPSSLEWKSLAAQATSGRPDLAQARAAALGAAALAEEPSLRIVPTLNASAQTRVADQAIAGDRYYDTTLTVNMNWNIWDAGLRAADAASRRASADVADLQVRALERKIIADVRSAVAALVAGRSSLVAAQDGVEAARKSAEETAVLYKQGLARAIELFNANSSTFDAEVALAAAQLGLRSAELDLRAALGLFPVPGVN